MSRAMLGSAAAWVSKLCSRMAGPVGSGDGTGGGRWGLQSYRSRMPLQTVHHAVGGTFGQPLRVLRALGTSPPATGW